MLCMVQRLLQTFLVVFSAWPQFCGLLSLLSMAPSYDGEMGQEAMIVHIGHFCTLW